VAGRSLASAADRDETRVRVTRRGHLIVEALCALALSGVLMATAAVALGNARRALVTVEQTARTQRAAREAVAIAASLLRDAESVDVLGDTAASAAILIALGAACAIEPSRRAILLPPVAIAVGQPITTRSQPVEPGDILSILAVDTLASITHWTGTIVDSVSERTSAPRCGVVEGWVATADASAPRVRLVLRDSLPEDAREGAPVRITRRGRFALYHAGAGDWMLGWRRCAPDGSSCGAIQPVAGPLSTPGTGGFRVRRAGVAGLAVSAKGNAVAKAESSWVPLRGAYP
jgi:hypothetical protein